MMKEFLASTGLGIYPAISLVIFVVVFSLVVLYVFLGMRRPDEIRRLASLPLEEQDLRGHGDAPPSQGRERSRRRCGSGRGGRPGEDR